MNQKHILLKVKKSYAKDRHFSTIEHQTTSNKSWHLYFAQRMRVFHDVILCNQLWFSLFFFFFLDNPVVLLISTMNMNMTGYDPISPIFQFHLQSIQHQLQIYPIVVLLKALVYYHFPIKQHWIVQIVAQISNEQFFHQHL